MVAASLQMYVLSLGIFREVAGTGRLRASFIFCTFVSSNGYTYEVIVIATGRGRFETRCKCYENRYKNRQAVHATGAAHL